MKFPSQTLEMQEMPENYHYSNYAKVAFSLAYFRRQGIIISSMISN